MVVFHLLPPLSLASQTSDSSTCACVSQICTCAAFLLMGRCLGSHSEVLHLLQLYLKCSGLLPKLGSWFLEALGCLPGWFLKNKGCVPECTLCGEQDGAVRSCLHYCFHFIQCICVHMCVCVYTCKMSVLSSRNLSEKSHTIVLDTWVKKCTKIAQNFHICQDTTDLGEGKHYLW